METQKNELYVCKKCGTEWELLIQSRNLFDEKGYWEPQYEETNYCPKCQEKYNSKEWVFEEC